MIRRALFLSPFVILLILACVLYFQLGKDSQYMPSALVGKEIPDFSLVSLTNDQIMSRKDLPEQSYLINFWGTWCPACHVEHPFLNQLEQEGVLIVGINYKDNKELAKNWLSQRGNPYQIVLMDELGQFGVDMGITGAPETFVVNANGDIVYRHQGPISKANWPMLRGYLE